MKKKLLISSLLSLGIFFLVSCTKEQLLNENTGHILRLTLQGNSIDSLECLINNKIVKTIGGSFNTPAIIGFDGEQQELQIRSKSSGAIIQSKIITATPFDQTITLYYDGSKAYDKVIKLFIKGYALSGELEFLVGGQVIYTGSGSINKENLDVLMNENSSREIQVRKKGETAVLLSKTITSTPDKQTINFFFDGTSVVDNVQLAPPVNAANMRISAKFQSIYATLGYFRNVDVDLIFYERNTVTGVATKLVPELRFTLPVSGAFKDIDLPPLTGGKDVVYGCDIVEKGTDILPYTAAATVAPFIPAALPYAPNVGRFGNPITFEAGKSKLLVIGDNKFLKTTAPRSTSYGITVTDLSQYFK